MAHKAITVTGINVLEDESEKGASIAVGMAEEIETLVSRQIEANPIDASCSMMV
ncbi:MAG: hypothetical protein JXA42_11325 [Anaerolineales bacterium]|nr:hypothetical protein [Anaerolineales bacterium]